MVKKLGIMVESGTFVTLGLKTVIFPNAATLAYWPLLKCRFKCVPTVLPLVL